MGQKLEIWGPKPALSLKYLDIKLRNDHILLHWPLGRPATSSPPFPRMEVWPRMAQHPLIFAESLSLQIVPHISTNLTPATAWSGVTIAISSVLTLRLEWPPLVHPPHNSSAVPSAESQRHFSFLSECHCHLTLFYPHYILEERGRGEEARRRADSSSGGAEG